MPAKTFKIAMSNRIHIGPYDPPLLNANQGGCEWLILRRWGDKGQFLEISDTTLEVPNGDRVRGSIPNCEIPDKAPPSLLAHQSMLGVMVREDSSGDAVFLLVRRNVDDHTMSGKFYPVDGHAVIKEFGNDLVLVASGRHAHDQDGNDIPNPGPSDGGMSWHFDAAQIAWDQSS